jgi:hypothetical protein
LQFKTEGVLDISTQQSGHQMTLRHIGVPSGGRVLAEQESMQNSIHSRNSRAMEVLNSPDQEHCSWQSCMQRRRRPPLQPGTQLPRHSVTMSLAVAGGSNSRTTATPRATTASGHLNHGGPEGSHYCIKLTQWDSGWRSTCS